MRPSDIKTKEDIFTFYDSYHATSIDGPEEASVCDRVDTVVKIAVRPEYITDWQLSWVLESVNYLIY